MSRFGVTGRYKSRTGWNDFTTTIDAPNEDVARERTFATLGSRHGLKRAHIDIDAIEEE